MREARKQEDIITAVGNGMRSLRILDDIRDFDVEEEVKKFRKQLEQFKIHEEERRKMEAGGGNRKVGGEKRKADAL